MRNIRVRGTSSETIWWAIGMIALLLLATWLLGSIDANDRGEDGVRNDNSVESAYLLAA